MDIQQAAEEALEDRGSVLSWMQGHSSEVCAQLKIDAQELKALRGLVRAAQVVIWQRDLYLLAT